MEEYLLIGGPADGKRMSFSNGALSYVRVPIMKEFPVGACGEIEYQQNGAIEYRKETLRSGDKTFHVYVTGDDDVIERLINGYKPDANLTPNPYEEA